MATVGAGDRAKKRIAELEQVCAELYQVLGIIADHASVTDHPDVQRALDNAARGRLVHRNLLPWPKSPLPARTRTVDGAEVDVMSIKQFCRRYGISEAFFYKLQRNGKGPRTIRLGQRTLITTDAAANWLREREADTKS